MVGLLAHPESPRLAKAVSGCVPWMIPWSGTIYRSSSPRRANAFDLVAGRGSRIHGGRWNPPSLFDAVYASLEPETALAEIRLYSQRAGVPIDQLMPRFFVALRVRLTRLLNISDGRIRRRLRISLDRMLLEKWWNSQAAGSEALTQAVGRLAWEAGAEGLLVPSAAKPSAFNVVVFPGNLTESSELSVLGEQLAPQLPISGETST